MDIPTARLQGWASSLIDFLHDKHPEIPAAIAQSGQLQSLTSRRTFTLMANARSASCRSITPWACARFWPWR